MATTGIVRGKDYALHSNAVQITHLTTCSLSMSGETIDVTSFDSSDWKDFLFEDKSWTIEAEAFLAFDGAENINELVDDFLAGTSQVVLLTTGETGDTTFTGSAYITACNVSNAKGSASTVSVTYQGTGALTKGTVA